MYVVDVSVDMGNLIMEVIRVNNFDYVIFVFVGKIEDVELFEKVDIILFEWMGIFLVFEFMIDLVFFVRDKWLKL